MAIKGHWAQKVQEDIDKVHLDKAENNLMKMKKSAFKNFVRKQVVTAVFCSLKVTQSSNIKFSAIKCTDFICKGVSNLYVYLFTRVVHAQMQQSELCSRW